MTTLSNTTALSTMMPSVSHGSLDRSLAPNTPYTSGISIQRTDAPVVEINAPAWFEDPEFLHAISTNQIMTWHQAGEGPGEFSDVILFIAPSLNGEGSDQGDIPDAYWDAVVKACKSVVEPDTTIHHIIVRITNMD